MVADTQQSSAHAAHFNSAVYTRVSLNKKVLDLVQFGRLMMIQGSCRLCSAMSPTKQVPLLVYSAL